jgi:hypothetical protein
MKIIRSREPEIFDIELEKDLLAKIRAVQISWVSYVCLLKLLAFWTSFGCL